MNPQLRMVLQSLLKKVFSEKLPLMEKQVGSYPLELDWRMVYDKNSGKDSRICINPY